LDWVSEHEFAEDTNDQGKNQPEYSFFVFHHLVLLENLSEFFVGVIQTPLESFRKLGIVARLLQGLVHRTSAPGSDVLHPLLVLVSLPKPLLSFSSLLMIVLAQLLTFHQVLVPPGLRVRNFSLPSVSFL
jgi:hypothetical protein